MEIIKDIEIMRARSKELRSAGKSIAFVPTMGALHEGHLSLIDIAKEHGDIVVMSIYLNPTQFGENEDLSKYPSNLEKDLELAKNRGIDIIFCPTNETIYPNGFEITVEVTGITNKLCGASRPTHFSGVTTVVSKLFDIVKPQIAVFGQKDYQQLKVIEQMVCNLNLSVTIIGAPIVRERDGLAISSRNQYLNGNERRAATAIFESLMVASEMVKDGETNSKTIISKVTEVITGSGIAAIDYVEICHPQTLESLTTIDGPALLAIAAHFGRARLIDNIIL